MVMNNLKVHIGVNSTFGEPQAMKVAINPYLPNSRSMFEPIQGFLQFTHMGLIPMSHKAFWLFNADFLINFSIEEGCFYIHLNTTATEKIVLIVVYLSTGAKISS